MNQALTSGLVSAYLLLCIVFGGSAQGTWNLLAIQVLGIILIAWAAVSPRDPEPPRRKALTLNLLVIGGLLVVLVQLIPLPASIWRSLPGRESLVSGYEILGYPLPALPISQTPYLSVMGIFAAIPAIAVLVAVERLRPSHRALAATIIVGLVLGIAFGALQVAGGPFSWAYFYEVTNPGAVGFFANRNHMATLLLIGIPMAAALVTSTKIDRGSATAKYMMATALLLVISVGILLNNSFAALGLAIPVVLASAAIIPAAVKWRRLAAPAAIVALVVVIAILVSKPILAESSPEVSRSFADRSEIWSTTIEASAASFPVGTGLGSFPQVYRQHENPNDVTPHYVNHAHNDYLEVVLELGVAGAILLAAFLAWWAVAAVQIWKSPLSTAFARGASIATAAVLAHSIVDFPLRTAALSAIFAACVGIMAQHLRSSATARAGEFRPTRHVRI